MSLGVGDGMGYLLMENVHIGHSLGTLSSDSATELRWSLYHVGLSVMAAAWISLWADWI